MSAQTDTSKRKSVRDIAAAKGKAPVVCLTAYTAPMARLLDPHADILLVGDSLGMVIHGLNSTVGVTLDMMILHGKAVMRGSSKALVVVDLPFGSYEESHEVAWRSASRVMMETGCQAVKVESGEGIADTIAFLVDRGIPVMGHVGLRPQAMNVDGGFRAKGRTKAERDRVLREALAADRAGAFAIVVEGVAEDIAAEISSMVRAPTIGIGASAQCDGQILVTDDMLGMFDWTPKFVRRYAELGQVIDQAVCQYAEDVKARTFPAEAETYVLKRTS
ncbi:3-methyl-2-oxobutanoate hydroxymethyltransferase [Candidatus Phycosocius bacilliformis]|uniref:3-methyl-2-oxobutanoate hydroxymethyltransferase n=1 Tax=Candidatus Phycosocius bacilliformis TaxID=1445552 RepID=A0A2P2E8E8_9PROT|nr:3-methyl-2-oxobutanoate hydroxymethyltransferase [Candidatus Phycosocius bacilliformis]GBF57339.1 3-methyl-2-oxobutanoate hydroxymethyltransferase [Candidatus Phycosocius bacilliformis]